MIVMVDACRSFARVLRAPKSFFFNFVHTFPPAGGARA